MRAGPRGEGISNRTKASLLTTPPPPHHPPAPPPPRKAQPLLINFSMKQTVTADSTAGATTRPVGKDARPDQAVLTQAPATYPSGG